MALCLTDVIVWKGVWVGSENRILCSVSNMALCLTDVIVWKGVWVGSENRILCSVSNMALCLTDVIVWKGVWVGSENRILCNVCSVDGQWIHLEDIPIARGICYQPNPVRCSIISCVFSNQDGLLIQVWNYIQPLYMLWKGCRSNEIY